MNSPMGRLRIIAILEGISYLLLFITMPLKYQWNMPQPNYSVGMAHGVLFIAYVILVLQNWKIQKWSFATAFKAGIASIIPFGTFIADRRIFKDQQISPQP